MRRLAALPLLVVLVISCGDDADSSSSTTASSGGSSETTESTLAGETLSLSSPAFGEGDMIPTDFAGCVDGERGPNESPPLEWSDVPDSAVEVAVTVVDPDADGFIHWVVAGVDPTASGFEAGEVPAEAVEAFNDTGAGGWFGPCPPEAHTYVFTVHALGEPSGVTVGMEASEALAAVAAATELQAELSAEFDPAG